MKSTTHNKKNRSSTNKKTGGGHRLRKRTKKHRYALFFDGNITGPSLLYRIIAKILSVPYLETTLFLGFLGYCIYINSFRVAAIGTAVLFVLWFLIVTKELKFAYWYLKVFVFQRDFYAHRRALYKQGTLWNWFFRNHPETIYPFYHPKANHKDNKIAHHYKPKTFNTKGGRVIIWGPSVKEQHQRFKDYQKGKYAGTSVEYFSKNIQAT